MNEFLKKDLLGNWNTVPPVPDSVVGNVNCHKFILYTIGKISWEDMVSDSNNQKDDDFTFGNTARGISNTPFTFIKDLESLMMFADENCQIGKSYVGQILDVETEKLAHSFIAYRESKDKYICFDKPGFKYSFSVHGLEEIINFVNKDGEKSNQNQKWRFILING